MSNKPVEPTASHSQDLPTGFDPAYAGNGEYNEFEAQEISTNTEVSANTPAIREEIDHSQTKKQQEVASGKTVAGGTWVALIIGAILLIGLLIFIMQNQTSVELNLFAWSFQFPAGIGFLLAAVTGALIMALVGGVRMFEYRRQIKKLRKSL
ncbi:LapA family protein [Corynebacterium callunae]|uniref:Lipopolysaccharide assembly protein A domain-containing protein n=1 Tax=Corynebacterium callunae DSM 20147 TaxID=1121353 RepID=M1TSB6_9CORY|nr:lipopolysaccharide assembly protein LapA domain-containing protein [Corynebacterium callunae]AGG67146.1 hypothetical protein H924_08530 [Corynebacterium callunae DSM 20147]